MGLFLLSLVFIPEGTFKMGISQDSWHKRRATGGKRPQPRKKRKFELGRPAAMTKIGAKRVHTVRTRGGHQKFRGLRLDTGNFSWGSEAISRKSRIIDVMYNASNNELLRTKTLVKNAIIQIDSTHSVSGMKLITPSLLADERMPK